MSGSIQLPPDRSRVETEGRNAASTHLDSLSTTDFLALMCDDHQRVIDAVRQASGSLATFIDALVPRMRSGGRLIYFGAGTSGRLGVLDASECPPTFQADPNQVIGIIAGGDASLRKSSEGKEDDPEGVRDALQHIAISDRDTALGIAAGGTTPYVLGGLRIAKSFGTVTGLLTCAAPVSSPLDCDHLIVLPTGAEILTGSTRLKAGSATKLALNIISTAAFTQLGKVYGNLMVDLRASNAKLLDRAIRILQELCPELSRHAAAAALDNAGGHLKTAIIMQRLDLDRIAAAELLAQNDHRLRDVFSIWSEPRT